MLASLKPIEHSGDTLVTIWVEETYLDPEPGQPSSARFQVVNDCKSGRFQLVESAYYRRPYAGGTSHSGRQYYLKDAIERLETPVEKSIGAIQLEVTCSTPHDEQA